MTGFAVTYHALALYSRQPYAMHQMRSLSCQTFAAGLRRIAKAAALKGAAERSVAVVLTSMLKPH